MNNKIVDESNVSESNVNESNVCKSNVDESNVGESVVNESNVGESSNNEEVMIINNAYTESKPDKSNKNKNNNEDNKKELVLSTISAKVDRSRSDISKTRAKSRDNDRKYKMARNDCGWGEEV